MSYLVMECHLGYAVVLSSDGRFLKVANMNYQPGEYVEEIHEMSFQQPERMTIPIKRWASAAACMAVMVFGAWQLVVHPIGTVEMVINPDVLMTVNRLNYVTKLTGLNEDGEDLIQGVSCFGKDLNRMTSELAHRAEELGYLKPDGTITFSVYSDNEDWKLATEETLVLELEIDLGEGYTIYPNMQAAEDQEETVTQTVAEEDDVLIIDFPSADDDQDDGHQVTPTQPDDDDGDDDDDDVTPAQPDDDDDDDVTPAQPDDDDDDNVTPAQPDDDDDNVTPAQPDDDDDNNVTPAQPDDDNDDTGEDHDG